MIDEKKIMEGMALILEAIGEDPGREGLVGTPRRVAEMYGEFFSGMRQDPTKELTVGFNESHTGAVILKDIRFFSICEHHFLPFFGNAQVGYIPNGRVVGVSKLARALDVLARRPQLQERLTDQFVDAVYRAVNPLGVVAVLSAEHLCISLRGVEKPGSKMLTSASRGNLVSNSSMRNEILNLMRGT